MAFLRRVFGIVNARKGEDDGGLKEGSLEAEDCSNSLVLVVLLDGTTF
jgi:hypothetical protein